MADVFVAKYTHRVLDAHEPLIEKYLTLTDQCEDDLVHDALELFAKHEIPARLYFLEHGQECVECASRRYIHVVRALKAAGCRKAA